MPCLQVCGGGEEVIRQELEHEREETLRKLHGFLEALGYYGERVTSEA